MRNSVRKHSTRTHSARKHSARKHSTRKHSTRKHSARKHSARKHSARKNKKYGGAKNIPHSVDRCAACGGPIVDDNYVIKNQRMYHQGCINTGTDYKSLKRVSKIAGVTK